MKRSVNRPAFRLAFCAVLSALCLVIMLLSSIIPIGTLAIPALSGLIITFAVVEYGGKWGFGVFAAVSLLSVFVCGDKEAVLYFIALFGYYPILKNIIEGRIKKKAVQYIFKFAVFNAAAVASFYISVFLLSVPIEEFSVFGVSVPLLFLAAGNVCFILYDYAITVFVFKYVTTIRKKLFK